MIDTRAARRAIESLYDGICTVTERQKVKSGNRTTYKEVDVITDEPCRISFSSIPSTAPNENLAAGIAQAVKLFIAPELEIQAGSRIAVTQNGRTLLFTRTGESATYTTHQELNLEIFKDWA